MISISQLHQRVFDGIVPWSGRVPAGYRVDFLGTLIDISFWKLLGMDPASEPERDCQAVIPTIENWGEGCFEALNWIEAAREASGRFVMMTLGACFGYQAVGAFKALQAINPMPCKLVMVEPEPTNCQFIRKHLKDNGIKESDHWLVSMALSATNDVAFFPIGAPGTGAQNLLSADVAEERRNYLGQLMKDRKSADKALENLLLHNSTGYIRDVSPGMNHPVEIKYVSCITLRDLLAPFDHVDYIEADLQMAEILVFPPFMKELNEKVRRVHIGTHGHDAHRLIRQLFASNDWEILFDFEPFTSHVTDMGSFESNDGTLTAVNPRISRKQGAR